MAPRVGNRKLIGYVRTINDMGGSRVRDAGRYIEDDVGKCSGERGKIREVKEKCKAANLPSTSKTERMQQ
jgi:hypothetical protein